MSSITMYAIPGHDTVAVDDAAGSLVSWLPDWTLRDGDDSDIAEQHHEFTLADAMAASGDYFVTLATRLDKLAQGLPQDSAEQIELEHQVQTLLYLQDRYDIVAKHKRAN